MVGTIVHQLTKNLTSEQIENSSFANYYINHNTGVYPCDSNGVPFSAATFAVTGDPITDLVEDLAADATFL